MSFKQQKNSSSESIELEIVFVNGIISKYQNLWFRLRKGGYLMNAKG